ncbi:hypothetical protein SDJN02_03774 [Cucurbita argyrosperma subsp. argyrosperma]|nr:hypothetical protein SDJN02_03774 [Cucurbita argyrosperma subsp. argyrosperma]
MQRCCSRRPNLRICFAGSPIGAVECFLLSPKQRLSYCRRYPGILQSHPPIPAPNFPVGVRLGLVGPVGGSEPRLCICRAPPGRRERCNSLQCLRRKKNPRIEAWLALARPESWMDAIEQMVIE